MLELAEILRAAGPEVRARVAAGPHRKRALDDILRCRTEALGGQVFVCTDCRREHYSYHSCGNRHCPKCHGQQTEAWLEKQRRGLLPCAYYLMTFTLPSELRAVARTHPKVVYGCLLRCAAAAIQELSADPRWLGAQPALLGVLHTWTRALLYHPHAHFLVSAGGLTKDGAAWREPGNPRFFLPVHALSKIFRGKMSAALAEAGLVAGVSERLWRQKKWVVHAQPAGRGEKVLEYLGRYVFRIAISQSRLERLAGGQLTFRYRENRSQELRRVTLPVADFLQRFCQHILPPGLPKVRHYGLDASACGARKKRACQLLAPSVKNEAEEAARAEQSPPANAEPRRCPYCQKGRLVWVKELMPHKKKPP